MFQEEFSALANAARAKTVLLKENFAGYFVSSMMAGMYVGFGITLIFTIGGLLTGAPFAKILMGMCFGIALSLVIIAGSELFTGNHLFMTAGLVENTVNWSQTLWLWLVCFIGNWVGSIVMAWMFWQAGLAVGPVGEFIAGVTATKMNLPLGALFFRGILCNFLVCLAIWSSFRVKSDSGKLIMIFWCLFAFITTGFEHSVANMTLLTIGLFAPFKANITMLGYFYNIIVVSLGNMVGGILFVALPYAMISRKK